VSAAVPRRTGLALAALLAVGTARVPARGEETPDPLRIQGRAVDTWLDQLAKTKGKPALEAAAALAGARFSVEAAPRVVEGLRAALEATESRDLALVLARTLGEFGPLARSADSALSPWHNDSNIEVLVARIRTGPKSEQILSELVMILRQQMPPLGAGREGFRLSVRGGSQVVDAIALEVGLWPEELLSAHELGPAAQGLVKKLEMEAWRGDRAERRAAYLALAGCALKEATAGDVVKAASVERGPWDVLFTQRIGRYQDRPTAKILEYLRARSSQRVTPVAAWAFAGLARLAPDAAAQLPHLRKLLTHQEPEARAGALEALRLLGKDAAPALDDVRALLADPDVRARWRAGAVCLAHGRDVAAARSALAKGIDGPDDLERLSAIEAAGGLGLPAVPLLARIEQWHAEASRFELVRAVTLPAITNLSDAAKAAPR
jgi:hypothetical protein